ncbi:hypothetical protein [Lentzea sp.]|uniref:hypothetical protein n=1 Tax=Lentzea sp. TaxID=56099 RepID=UPI002ED2853C
MTQPQDPWSNPDNAQWQNPAASYPPQPGQYQVSQVGQASFSMAPLAPVLPQELGPARPPTVTAAMWIWIAAAVLSVAVLPVMLLTNTDFFLSGDSITSERDRQAGEIGLRVMATLAGFGMLIAAAPYVAFAIVMRGGKSWARILLTILGALGLATMVAITFIAIGGQVWQPAVTMTVVIIGLTVAALVLQFLPPSNRYIR